MSALLVDREDQIVTIGFDRPGKRNALDLATVDEFHAVLDSVGDHPSILILRSTTPGTFVAGADISELRGRTATDAMLRINGRLFDRIASYRWPTIAAIDGPALGGGCELALSCDFRVATPNARFGQPEPRLGIMAAAGGNWRLERTAGLSVARRMLFAGDTLDSGEALTCGLVDEIVAEPSALLAAARDLAERIRKASWQALEFTKVAISLQAPPGSAAFDAAAQAVLFESDEKRARMDRFLDRRSCEGGSRP